MGEKMKEWKFKKQDLDCTLTINDEAVIKLKINDGVSYDMEKLEQGAVHFFGNRHLIINGEEKVIRGLILDNYDEIKTYYDDMKNKINSQYRKKKEKMLEGVQWNIEEYSERDEGGKTKSYKHIVTVDGETFVFKERNLFDVGRVINPAYKISNGFFEGGIPSCKDGKWIWLGLDDGWKEVREMTENETKAFEIVRKYGKYAKLETEKRA